MVASIFLYNVASTTATDEGGNVTSVKAMLLAKAGDAREAEKYIQRAIEIGKNFGHFHQTAFNIASAYALLGKRVRPCDGCRRRSTMVSPAHRCSNTTAL